MNIKSKILLICIICLTLISCNGNVIKNIEVANKQYFKSYKISDEKRIDNFSDFLEELSWEKDGENNDFGSESIVLTVHYKSEDEEVKYAIYDKSDGTSILYNTSSKENYVNLNKEQTKMLKKIIEQ